MTTLSNESRISTRVTHFASFPPMDFTQLRVTVSSAGDTGTLCLLQIAPFQLLSYISPTVIFAQIGLEHE